MKTPSMKIGPTPPEGLLSVHKKIRGVLCALDDAQYKLMLLDEYHVVLPRDIAEAKGVLSAATPPFKAMAKLLDVYFVRPGQSYKSARDFSTYNKSTRMTIDKARLIFNDPGVGTSPSARIRSLMKVHKVSYNQIKLIKDKVTWQELHGSGPHLTWKQVRAKKKAEKGLI